MTSIVHGWQRSALVVASLVAVVALAACNSDEDSTPTSTPTTTASPRASASVTPTATSTPVTGGGGGDAPNDVDLAKCEPIGQIVQAVYSDQTLLVDATAFEAGGGSLVAQGCRVLVFADRSVLPSFPEVSQTLQQLLIADGWEEDSAFLADGPTGTQSLFRKGEEMALVTAGISPADPSACPSDQVISACLEELEDNEVLIQGAIIVAVD